MLEAVRQRAKEAYLGNIETLKSGKDKLPLERDSLDGALMVSALHLEEAANRSGLIKAVAKALKVGAWVAVVETRAEAQHADLPPGQRISEDELLRMGTKAGLRQALRRELNSDHYLVVLRK